MIYDNGLLCHNHVILEDLCLFQVINLNSLGKKELDTHTLSHSRCHIRYVFAFHVHPLENTCFILLFLALLLLLLY